jgi:hypothetical protein
MGTMQRERRLRREIEGKTRIRVLPRPFRQLAKALEVFRDALDRLPADMRAVALDRFRPGQMLEINARQHGKTMRAIEAMQAARATGKPARLLILDEIAEIEPILETWERIGA